MLSVLTTYTQKKEVCVCLGVMHMFITLSAVISWVYAFVHIYQNVYIKYV